MQGAIAVRAASGRVLAARMAWSRWAWAERGRWALWLPVCMGAGVVWDLTARAEPVWWAGFSAFGAASAAAFLARPFPALRALLAAVAAAGLGVSAAQFATWEAPARLELPRRATVIEGVARLVETLPEGGRVTLEAARLDGGPALARRLRIRLHAGDTTEILPGEAVRVRAMVSPPAPPAYPGAWDLQRDAYFSGIGGYGFALGSIERIPGPPPSSWALWLHGLRRTVAGRAQAALAGTEGAIAATLLTGFTGAIPEADKAAFRDSGLAHLLAIAGLHIGIVMGLVLGTVRLGLACWEWAALRLPCKAIAVLVALAAGGAYMLMTGSHVPILRSFAMACLVALGVLAGRRAVSVRGLALAASVILLIAPNEVLGVSFQLSFSAVLALIGGYEALRGPMGRLRARSALLHHLAALALTSALAGTASAPYAAYHFGHFQLYYVLANMAAVPITAFWVMPAGLLSLALMPFHLEWLTLTPMGWGIEALLWIGRTVSALPAAVLAVRPAPSWGIVVLTIGVAWLGIFRTRARLAGCLAIAVGLVSPLLDRPPDILVSADARLIAVRTPAGVFEEVRSGVSRFTREAWLQYWAVAHAAPLPAVGGAEGSSLSCTPARCALGVPGPGEGGAAAVLLLRRGTGGVEACAARLLISPEPIRLRCEDRVPWVDRFSVWRDGAHAVWLGKEGPRVLSDRMVRGDRPWVPPPPKPRPRP